jgi:hypothetical protein
MKVQLALGSRWVLKKDIANALSKYGVNTNTHSIT